MPKNASLPKKFLVKSLLTWSTWEKSCETAPIDDSSSQLTFERAKCILVDENLKICFHLGKVMVYKESILYPDFIWGK